MYKTVPALYVKHQSDWWKYHDFAELVECINSIREELGRKTLSPVEVFERFAAMNVYSSAKSGSWEQGIVCTKWTSDYDELHFLGEALISSTLNSKQQHKLLTAAGWGMRVLEAVKRGGERAERVHTVSGLRVRSRVYCGDEAGISTSFVM